MEKHIGNNTTEKKFTENGEEIMDPTPVASAMKFKQRSQFSDIRRYIANELSRQAAENDQETLQEADDFNVGDDFDPTSPYEEQFDPESGQSTFEAPFIQEKPVSQDESGNQADPPVDKTPSTDKTS